MNPNFDKTNAIFGCSFRRQITFLRTLSQRTYSFSPEVIHCVFKRQLNYFIRLTASGDKDHKPVNYRSMSSFLKFICFKISSLVKSNVLWITMVINKTFYKFMIGDFGRGIVRKKAIFISIVTVYFSENKALSLLS